MTANLNNTLGAIFFGTSVSCILFGITIVQTYLYYCNFPKDWMLFKVSVGVLITLATLHLTVTLHAAHYYLITNFDHPSGPETMIWSFRLQIIVNALVVVIVQSLYALRVWKLGGRFSKIWPTLVALIVAGGLGLGIYGIVRSYKITGFADIDEDKPIVFSGFITTTTIDVVIAFAMCYYLNRNRSSFIQTNNVIFIAVRYVLISGCLTSACSLSALITYVVMPRTLVFIGINFLLPNLYINSYIAMLNARIWMNEREVSPLSPVSTSTNVRSAFTGNLPLDDADVIHLSSLKRDCSCTNKYDLERNIPPKHIGIVVHRTEERTYDHYS